MPDADQVKRETTARFCETIKSLDRLLLAIGGATSIEQLRESRAVYNAVQAQDCYRKWLEAAAEVGRQDAARAGAQQ